MILADKTAIVTGSSRGIGRAVAIEFAREGADVAVIATKRVESAQEVANTIMGMGKRAIVVKADITNREQVKNLVDTTLKEFGKIDILVNNAGIWGMARFWKTPPEVWQEMINVNLMGAVNCINGVIEHMMQRKSGKIINTTSLAAEMGAPRMSAYGAAKGAIISLTRSLARELAPYKINVNAIAPQAMSDMSMQIKEENPKYWEESLKMYLLGFPEAEDVAPAYAFLASDKAKCITGQILNVDGGAWIG